MLALVLFLLLKRMLNSLSLPWLPLAPWWGMGSWCFIGADDSKKETWDVNFLSSESISKNVFQTGSSSLWSFYSKDLMTGLCVENISYGSFSFPLPSDLSRCLRCRLDARCLSKCFKCHCRKFSPGSCLCFVSLKRHWFLPPPPQRILLSSWERECCFSCSEQTPENVKPWRASKQLHWNRNVTCWSEKQYS